MGNGRSLFKSLVLLCLLVSAERGFVQSTDMEGCKDYPLFNRMPGYSIRACSDLDFDVHVFRDSQLNEIWVEGRSHYIRYTIESRTKMPSQI